MDRMGDTGRKDYLQNASGEEYRLIPVEQGYYVEEDEKFIDVVGIVRDIWDNKKTIFKTVIIVLCLGIASFFVSERMYYAEASLMPEAGGQSQVSRLMQQYQGIFGSFTPSAGNDEIGVTLYPRIVESRLFLIDLIQTPVYFDEYDRELTLFEYFHDLRYPSVMDRAKNIIWDLSFGLPATIQRWFSSNGSSGVNVNDFTLYSNMEEPIRLDADIRAATEAISTWITVYIDPQTGFIVIGASMPDASAAAGTVMAVMEKLQEEIIEYRTEKANQTLEQVEGEYDRIIGEYFSIQDSLAAYLDNNLNINTESARVAQDRLENETRRLETLYNSINTQLEEAQMRVNEETPVFSTHEPAFIPGRPSSPDLTRILLGSIFVGLFLGISLIYARRIWANFYSEFRDRGDHENRDQGALEA